MFHQAFHGISPFIIFLLGALVIPFVKGGARRVLVLAIPLAGLLSIWATPHGLFGQARFLGMDMVLYRMDGLSMPFGIIFCLITFIASIYAFPTADTLEYTAGFFYAGGALGVTFAGDLFSLYLNWEIMAVASTFLILARRTQSARNAAFRYILVHVFGGLCLLAGIVLYYTETGSLVAETMALKGVTGWLVFIGVAVNAAVFPLHAWLKDAYPEATVAGAVFLSAFTTKSAVYTMARLFPGAAPLIVIGACMTVIPIFFAVLENDIRRVLSYSLMNQVGFMLCGVGIGTQLAINGTVSHAFCHILYKALLFMAAGSVLHVTGKIKCTDLGGLYKTMPLTCIFCMIASASISAFPFFSGFVSKSMIVSAAGYDKFFIIWLMLQFASTGVIDHAGIKVPYFTFFSHDAGLDAHEPPKSMLIAMGMAAFCCVFLGVYPQWLYSILPYPVHYQPYTATHVITQFQLLCFGALAFCLLIYSGKYPSEIRAINLDTDWFYRMGGRAFYGFADRVLNGLNSASDRILARALPQQLARFFKNGPAYLALLVVGPVQLNRSDHPDRLENTKSRLIELFESSTLPIGITVAAAASFFILLYVLA